MLLAIPGVLKPDEVALARSWLAGARFIDGRLTAGAAARRVKSNEELDADTADLERLNRLVMGNLARHPVYRAAAARGKPVVRALPAWDGVRRPPRRSDHGC